MFFPIVYCHHPPVLRGHDCPFPWCWWTNGFFSRTQRRQSRLRTCYDIVQHVVFGHAYRCIQKLLYRIKQVWWEIAQPQASRSRKLLSEFSSRTTAPSTSTLMKRCNWRWTSSLQPVQASVLPSVPWRLKWCSSLPLATYTNTSVSQWMTAPPSR